MTVQLAHPFLDLLWLTVTWNLGQTSNSDIRMKNEASSKSIPWWQCVAVAWNGTARGALRNELSLIFPGQGAVRGWVYGHIQNHCV